MKVLHVGNRNAITEQFGQFLSKNYDIKEHFSMGIEDKKYSLGKLESDFVNVHPGIWCFMAMVNCHKAQKIILHGLFHKEVILVLFLFPWLLKKCYWVIWGGDLYQYTALKHTLKWHISESLRHQVIKKIGYLITYIQGDVALARKWYGAKGTFVKCIMYPSNTYKPLELKDPNSSVLTRENISFLVGNSADPSNNHFEIFEKVRALDKEDFELICPLSYGNKDYAQKVVDEGIREFGDRFRPILGFIPFEKYIQILNGIDVAIFAHKRQQAMGNTINLLGLKKKVYIRSDVTPWNTLKELGIKVFDFSELNLEPIDPNEALKNEEIIREEFNLDNLLKQWKYIFEAEI